MNTKTELLEYSFESLSYTLLPGVSDYECIKHNITLKSNSQFHTEVGTIKDNVHIKDICVDENRFFKYQIIKPKDQTVAKRAILLLHGFNERDWTKYLPWAEAICEGTGSPVILFPLAFHMQRAPKHWSSKRDMYKLSEERKKRYPNIVDSTLSNVAISMRLHAMPQRFIYSGLQTYHDIIQLIEEFKSGKNPHISKDFEFDIFAYSIGGFLAQILKLSNYNNYFSNTKVCLFCSGTTFNRLSSVSKFILDSEANVALYSFLIEHFDKFIKKDSLLQHYILEDHLEGHVFYSMLDYQKKRVFREELLKKYEDQIYAITLKKDYVIPSFEVINTLQGAYRDINIKVDELDFDREYTHVNPFPPGKENDQQISKDFHLVFNKVCDFFNA
ncbi:DUF6051 family protein [Formosa sp. PL04]|uniref:DUF6051 family protein n=1 Tax=Formosa sp. PL04 TaxID=3081755 RepID=UPI002981A2E5|nr:DUF6051 family protein [Formosa sp. PL04]MDW5290900.1 DUF6051 family protein [Formosa sp. PL04]